ncbi:MAG: 30S ribosomal protein S12 methylthiotransferase RimO [Planctomycetes bacterium]|jgi:ribosomal protein S12 methylthiotransferase|nr:30S ribosomal protein S12 methylthiotransferase RimO [Planctomycetota bacterium]MCL4731846.1 30S ribosomal protein S12 methylthiotransferase RimO [Planctomycetota bacterium]
MKTALGSVAFVSLGCPKNLIDSETMLGGIAAEGYIVTPDYSDADVVVVNTCGFLDASRRESLDYIQRMLALKDKGSVKRVVVAGCMVGNYRDVLDREAPGVDALVSVNDRTRLSDVLRELSASGELARRVAISDPDEKGTVYDDRARLRMTPRHYAYLRISEGCDHKCSFCTIPSIRGRFRSKPRDRILAEARELAADGAKELIVVAQDSTYYGLDTDGRKTVHEVLADLCRVDGVHWVRLMYAYPTQVTDDLIDLLAREPKLNAYIDMPLQHISTPVLQRMRRGSTRDTTLRLIEKLRARVPGLTLRSTFIVGFPGETDTQFEELIEFIRQGHVDRAGAFPYSDEDKAASFALDGKLPADVIEARHRRFMEVNREVLFAANERLVGKTVQVLVDGPSQDPKYPSQGRSRADAPEIDCSVLLKGKHEPGTLLSAKVVRSLGFDLLCRTD